MQDPIGKHINPGLGDGTVEDKPREIVGIVGDVKSARLTEDVAPEYYVPFHTGGRPFTAPGNPHRGRSH